MEKKEKLKKFGTIAKEAGKKAGGLAKATGEKTRDVALLAKDKVIDAKSEVMSTLDQNGDGQVEIDDVIILALKTPGIRIKRDDFLQKELMKHYEQDVIDLAIATTPAQAKIDRELIDKIADDVIQYERVCVSGISAALGAPGGLAMVATMPADIVQYYGYMLRAAQKIMYLYGFPQIDVEEDGQTFDSETINILIICLGVMFGVAGAKNAILAMAKALGSGVEKQLLRRALTKGTIYPIVKGVAKWFNTRMTKEVFAGFFKKSIPVVGGVLGGGITYLSFKPCCEKLKESLKDTMLSNPEGHKNEESDIIDISFEEVEVNKE